MPSVRQHGNLTTALWTAPLARRAGGASCQEYPRNYPEDGDKPLLVPAPYDGLYDLYLMSKSDFYLRELDNYNNSALAYNTALDEWKKAYHRSHAPIGAGYYKNVF